MAFRITRLDTLGGNLVKVDGWPSGGTLVKVDGWLEAEGIAELERICGEPSAALTLDLGDLRQADESALGLLRRAAAQGARLVNCSPYLALLLGERADQGGQAEHEDKIP
jgi:hypothetical protein